MTSKNEALKNVFEILLYINPMMDEKEQLEFLCTMIPNSVMYYKSRSFRDADYWDEVKIAGESAKEEEDRGKWLYMISDSERIIHWFACPPGYEEYVRKLEPWLNTGEYFEPFNAEDYYQEDR